MATYSYIAFDVDGKKKKGFVSAQSEKIARAELKKLNLKAHTVKESNKDISKNTKIKEKDLSIATRQLATLLDANLSINEITTGKSFFASLLLVVSLNFLIVFRAVLC